MKDEKPTRPILRYFGGKWRNAKKIIAHFPAHRVYVEPYCGAASVLLRKPRSRVEVINDLDGDIVNLFRVLRVPDQAQRLIEVLRLTPFALKEFKSAYQQTNDQIENARRLICRSYMGFGGGAVHRKSTGFRRGVIRSGVEDFCTWPDHVKSFSGRLRGVIVESQPALEILRFYDSTDTLFYLDPPYPRSTRNERSRYLHEMTDDDHRELAAVARNVKGKVIVSGYACDLYDVELYPDWDRVEWKSSCEGQQHRIEVLWISPAAGQLNLFNQ
jgi:DNA adenine methylase